jgi:hypothetical protein
LDVDGLGSFHTEASDETMQPDHKDDKGVPDADSDSHDSGSEDSNRTDCSDNFIVTMYDSDQEYVDLEDYKF